MQCVIIQFAFNCHTGGLEVHVITRWCKLMQESSNYTTVMKPAHWNQRSSARSALYNPAWDMRCMCCRQKLMQCCRIFPFLKNILVFFYPVRSQLWHPVQMHFIPEEMNTSDSWAVNTPSATCQQWLMSDARSLSLPFPSSLPLYLLFTLFHKHTPTATHANHLQSHTRTHTNTHTLPSKTQTAGASLSWLAALRGAQRKMDRQELSARTQGQGVSFSLQIMKHMWGVSEAPIRSDDNYLSTSQSS